MHPLETYAREIHAIRGSGAAVKETSYYTALANLLNKVGKDKDLKPKVRFVSTISNQGWGIPDGGLFTIHQFQRANEPEPLPGHKPERGVVEVKGTGDNVDRTATTAQVAKYLEGYGQVLVTNYRDFLLVGRDADGQPVKLERYRLASSETAFHAAHADPEALVEEHGERFVEYLKRVMLHNAPLTAPKDVAWFLASYARDARVRLERQANLPALAQVRSSLEDALGIKFEGERGEHFFRSTLVQTLFYGIFSAWVLWSKEQEENDHAARFNWHDAVYLLRVPMIQALFEQVAMASRLRPLGLIEVLDWTAAALNRVDRTTFFANFEEDHAVQYFYEPFLEAFDPALRKQLGVWYTPQEIVRYMVARVDTVLREELGLPDGLADPRVYVLDPCCGTGTYIVEVLKRIAITLKEQGADALLGDDLKRAAMERIFGFEILPAPFVVAHLQLGLLLQNLGAPLSEAGDERAGVYLTNALTGWEPANSPKQHLLFPELEAERDAAERVKRETRILVILGNPPYNAFAGVSPKEEQGLVEPYKRGLISEWGIKKFNLDDLYVRFFRLAERHITEATRQGVVCYISNFSYLSDPSFVVMRQRFLAGFDSLWFDSLNGDSRETGKQTPEGKPDPSAFSTEQNREGIRVGATIGLMVRQAERSDQPLVRFRQFWGVTKREDLLASVTNPDLDAHYETAMPTKSNRYSFRPSDVAAHYEQWPKLTDLGVTASNGLMEKRGGALIDIDRDALEHRMQMYYDPLVSWETLEALDSRLTTDAARFDAKQARAKVLAAERYEPARLQRYALRPLETRWGYFSAVRPLWNEPRPALQRQRWQGNSFLLSRVTASRGSEGSPFYFSQVLSDDHLLSPDAVCFPLRLRSTSAKKSMQNNAQASLFAIDGVQDEVPTANLSPTARAYLTTLGIGDADADADTAGLIWMHALAIGYTPAYLSENADGIRQDWPRVPLPINKDILAASAALGRQVATLLDTECSVPGVTTGKPRPELGTIASITRVGGGQLSRDAGDLDLITGWGHGGQRGVVMPGRGKAVAREYTSEEHESCVQGAAALGLPTSEALARLGATTYDIYLNDRAYWRNVPARVWEYTIGGYQVIKKWLSYREYDLLGRALTTEEIREVMQMARRITAIVLLEPTLDANYHVITQSAYPWPVTQT